MIDQLSSTAGDHQVDEVAHLQQFVDVGAVGVRDHLDGITGDRGAGQCLLEEFAKRGIAVPRLLATAQDRGVPALQAEHGDVYRHVGTRFVDAGNHSERHAPSPDEQPVRQRTRIEDFADGVVEGHDLSRIGGDAAQSIRVESQSLDEVVIETRLARGGEVSSVCFQDRRLFGLEELRDPGERGVFVCRRNTSEGARSCPRGRGAFPEQRGRHGHCRSVIHASAVSPLE